eukprot:TRINITY_DN952_c0_g1_i2.p1 TRINITY_DN952_c0_g1~~TRINITY_DN952_c0_g1_i2.p1  ORF type:complete len:194 (+),score=40.71 TRINITY_DN952_c0_g1_i2:49-630(+)
MNRQTHIPQPSSGYDGPYSLTPWGTRSDLLHTLHPDASHDPNYNPYHGQTTNSEETHTNYDGVVGQPFHEDRIRHNIYDGSHPCMQPLILSHQPIHSAITNVNPFFHTPGTREHRDSDLYGPSLLQSLLFTPQHLHRASIDQQQEFHEARQTTEFPDNYAAEARPQPKEMHEGSKKAQENEEESIIYEINPKQ